MPTAKVAVGHGLEGQLPDLYLRESIGSGVGAKSCAVGETITGVVSHPGRQNDRRPLPQVLWQQPLIKTATVSPRHIPASLNERIRALFLSENLGITASEDSSGCLPHSRPTCRSGNQHRYSLHGIRKYSKAGS